MERAAGNERLGKPKRRVVEVFAERATQGEIGDPFGYRVERALVALVALVADGDAHAGFMRDASAGARDRADLSGGVPRDDTRADVDSCCLLDAAVATDCELRRPAADVDVEHERCRRIARERDRAGAVRGQKA